MEIIYQRVVGVVKQTARDIPRQAWAGIARVERIEDSFTVIQAYERPSPRNFQMPLSRLIRSGKEPHFNDISTDLISSDLRTLGRQLVKDRAEWREWDQNFPLPFGAFRALAIPTDYYTALFSEISRRYF
jgi:hypothetical protein